MAAVGALAGGLPVNLELPVTFGANSHGGDRLKGEILDAAIYSTVLTPKSIAAAAHGARPAVKPLWSGKPNVGELCDAVRHATFPRGFTLLVTLRAQGGYTVDITWMQGQAIDIKVTGGNPAGYVLSRGDGCRGL